MALYRALVTLNMTSGLAEDAATNTWHFDADTESDLSAVFGALNTFYQTVDTYLSSLIDPANITVEWYRLSDAPPRQPVRLDTMFGITVAGAAGPTEIALVLSYEGAKVSGLPQNRRRGRVYIGPLANLPGDRPTTGWTDALQDAGQGLLDASTAAPEWTWVQWSPTNQIGIDVQNGWIDNDWDVQRRRGRAATARVTFS